ncbi:MAG: hypothetical protein H5T63_09635, partial [Chloroflexi bacterium]|nr:hypothetical protein [Chloroflexota bacterium]
MWVGTHGGGLCLLDDGGSRCYKAADTALASDYVTSLLLAPDGRLWIGTEEGLNAFDPGDQIWWSWQGAWNLPHKHVNALAWDQQGRLWVGTDGGVSVFDGRSWEIHDVIGGLVCPAISAISSDIHGNLWLGTLGAGLVCYGSNCKELPPPRRPVILVHGWRGPDSDLVEDSEFRFLNRWLQRDGYTAIYATGISPDNTLHENACHLREVIAQAKAETGTSVDIIAFSMGGLNTRAYVESALYARDVHQVFIIGTPHAGVTMWKTLLLHEIAHWSDEPSARELLPEHVALFNATHSNSWRVPYYLFAGAVEGEKLPSLFGFLPPGDGLISAWSAHALRGPGVRYITTKDLHAWSDETILLE